MIYPEVRPQVGDFVFDQEDDTAFKIESVLAYRPAQDWWRVRYGGTEGYIRRSGDKNAWIAVIT